MTYMDRPNTNLEHDYYIQLYVTNISRIDLLLRYVTSYIITQPFHVLPSMSFRESLEVIDVFLLLAETSGNLQHK